MLHRVEPIEMTHRPAPKWADWWSMPASWDAKSWLAVSPGQGNMYGQATHVLEYCDILSQ